MQPSSTPIPSENRDAPETEALQDRWASRLDEAEEERYRYMCYARSHIHLFSDADKASQCVRVAREANHRVVRARRALRIIERGAATEEQG